MTPEDVIRHYGIRRLAGVAGCDESAIRQWLRGERPNPPKGLADAIRTVAEDETEIAKQAWRLSKKL